MANPLYRQLLSQARRLARLDPRRPKQANLRRAVSSTYYALFHYLVDKACRTIIGTHQDRSSYRYVLGRGFDHGTMKNACRSFSGGTLSAAVQRGLPPGFTVCPELRSVAETFVASQERRHRADYDLSETFNRADVLAHVADADQALQRFEQIQTLAETRFFLGCLLAWSVLSGRR